VICKGRRWRGPSLAKIMSMSGSLWGNTMVRRMEVCRIRLWVEGL
jgi:hypothetical protein